MPSVHLRVEPAQGLPFDHHFDGESLVVGRSSVADLRLPDRFLSRRHSRLFWRDGALFVEDLGSRNGTFVNGVAVVEPTPITGGDAIKICGSRLVLQPTDGRELIAPDSHALESVFRDATSFLQPIRRAAQSREATADPARLQQVAAHLSILNEVHEALGSSISLDELLELILDRAFDHLKPEQGVILLDEGTGTLRRAAERNTGGDPLHSKSLVREVVEKRMAALVLDAETDERFAAAESIFASGIRSLVAAPLLTDDDALGMILLASRVARRRFTEQDLELLVSLASVAAMRIRNVRLAQEAAERRRLEKELELARHIQMSLIPDQLPAVPGLELWAENLPSRGVSGDFYTAEIGPDGALGLLIADVSGKGIAAALLTASLEALVAGPFDEGLPPEEICRRVSRHLHRRTPPEKYATAILAWIAPSTGEVRFTNAGHLPAFLVRQDGSVARLASTGPPIGLLPNLPFRADQAQLDPNDLLVLFTDGLTEAESPDGEEFGLDRLEAACVEHREAELPGLGAVLNDILDEFAQGTPFADDRTLVLLRRTN